MRLNLCYSRGKQGIIETMTMDTGTENGTKLKGAFGNRGTTLNAMSYAHPHAKTMIAEARDLMMQCRSGQELVAVLEYHKIPLQIIKGSGEGGFSPEMMAIVLQVPGKINKMTAPFLLTLVKALREAAAEIGGAKTPSPLEDVMKYATFIHGRNLDSIRYICKFLDELTESLHYPVLLDSLTDFGFNEMYKAYQEGASDEQLYAKYVEAYNNKNGGSN
jgi:hypothetical protein